MVAVRASSHFMLTLTAAKLVDGFADSNLSAGLTATHVKVEAGQGNTRTGDCNSQSGCHRRLCLVTLEGGSHVREVCGERLIVSIDPIGQVFVRRDIVG